jgi:uncharacterized small protein (DUF1192 family)
MDLERCYELIADVAARRGDGLIEPLTDEEASAVLDLARVAAHTVERKAAPLVCYSVGRVLDGLDANARLALLREAIARMEAEAGRSSQG